MQNIFYRIVHPPKMRPGSSPVEMNWRGAGLLYTRVIFVILHRGKSTGEGPDAQRCCGKKVQKSTRGWNYFYRCLGWYDWQVYGRGTRTPYSDWKENLVQNKYIDAWRWVFSSKPNDSGGWSFFEGVQNY